jgi:4-amino-4-deoxy-L-arabinose transferase-like glycosyltransferase
MKFPERRGARTFFVLLTVTAALLWFGTLEYRELFQPDEGRYAEIPHEMADGGDWIVPHLDGLPYLEKPPLQYWASAAAFRLLGGDEWTARLWPALTGFLGVLAVLFTGVRLFGRRAGVLAALLLASTFEYVVLSQVLTLDMGLTLFLCAAVFCFLLAQQHTADPARQRGWMIGAWAAMGLAVLSKGLIGVLLPVLALAAYVGIERDTTVLRRLHLLPGMAVLLAITLPWLVAIQLRVPEFFDFFFLREHIARFATSGHHRPGAWYYFVGVFIAGALPWTAVYTVALVRGLRQAAVDARPIDAARFLALFAAVVLVFFSLSRSKLPAYILPMFPPLALLGGRELAARGASAMRVVVGSLGFFAVLIVAVALLLPGMPSMAALADDLFGYLPWMWSAAAVALLAAWLAHRLARSHYRLRALALVAVGALCSHLLLVNGVQEFSDRFSSERLVSVAELSWNDLDPAAPFYSVELYDQTLPLHLGHTLIVVAYRDELDQGLRLRPEGGLPDLESFRRAWVDAPRAYAVMRPARYVAERDAGLPMKVLAQDARYVVVARNEIMPTGGQRRSHVW